MGTDGGTVSHGAVLPQVLVVGNGPVGQTTALLLARWGVRVLLVDAREVRDVIGSKAICQQRDVLDVWDSVGAGAIAREGLTWTRARTFYRDRELSLVTLPDPGRSPLPPFVNISQSRTEQLLDQQIAGERLIDVRWGHEVVALDQDGDGVRARCRTAGGEVLLQTRYAVACGGARGSALRDSLGLDFPGRSFSDPFLICDIRAALSGWDQERRFYFDPEWNPGRQVLIHPCPDSTYRIDWQVEPDFDLDASIGDGSLDRRIRQVIGEQDYELIWSSVYRFHSRRTRRMRVGRVLLAGDLAHLFAPFGARGLNSGVGDADNAAWKLAFVLRGWAGPGLLDSYDAERCAAAQENLAVTTATMDFLVPRTPHDTRRRHELLQRAVDDPGVRQQIDSGRLAEPYWYVDSPLTTRDPQRPWPGRPPWGAPPAPIPGVVLPDAPVSAADPGMQRIRQLVRRQVTALVGDPQGAPAAATALDRALPTAVPRQVLALPEIDPTGAVRDSLQVAADDLWLIRPDAYTAARVTSPDELARAARRAIGSPT